MSIEVLASSVVAHRRARVGVACCDLHVAEIDAGIEHGGDEGVSEHVGMHAWQLYAGRLGETSQAAGCAVAIHAGSSAGQQDRTRGPFLDGLFDGAPDRGWKRDEDDFVALAVHAENPVTVFFAKVFDVATRRFEDAESEEAEHRDQGEVATVGRLLGRCDQRLELKIRQPKRGRLGRDVGSADILGR